METLLLLAFAAGAFFLLQSKADPAQRSDEPRDPDEPVGPRKLVPDDASNNEPRIFAESDPAPGEAIARIRAARARGEGGKIGARQKLPEGVFYARNGAAYNRIAFGERVLLTLVDAGKKPVGVLEGVYAGPHDVSDGPADVLVDRVAQHGNADWIIPGTYTVPASEHEKYHDRLDRVFWGVEAPSYKGFAAFESVPALEVGDKVTVLISDGLGTYLVAIAQVTSRSPDMLTPLTVYRVIEDAGKGEIVLPRVDRQASIWFSPERLLDPKSLKKPALS
jgi:hypothetical protein